MLRSANSTPYTIPSLTISERCEIVVPEDAPKYRQLKLVARKLFLGFSNIKAANLLLYGFHSLNSSLLKSITSIRIPLSKFFSLKIY